MSLSGDTRRAAGARVAEWVGAEEAWGGGTTTPPPTATAARNDRRARGLERDTTTDRVVARLRVGPRRLVRRVPPFRAAYDRYFLVVVDTPGPDAPRLYDRNRQGGLCSRDPYRHALVRRPSRKVRPFVP